MGPGSAGALRHIRVGLNRLPSDVPVVSSLIDAFLPCLRPLRSDHARYTKFLTDAVIGARLERFRSQEPFLRTLLTALRRGPPSSRPSTPPAGTVPPTVFKRLSLRCFGQ